MLFLVVNETKKNKIFVLCYDDVNNQNVKELPFWRKKKLYCQQNAMKMWKLQKLLIKYYLSKSELHAQLSKCN